MFKKLRKLSIKDFFLQVKDILSLGSQYYNACISIVTHCIDNQIYSPVIFEFLINMFNSSSDIELKVNISSTLSDILIKTKICDENLTTFYKECLQQEIIMKPFQY